MSSLSKVRSSDIELEIITTSGSKDKQRTEKWKKKRKGRWTGSQMKNLMSSSNQGGKISWLEPEKIFLFGTTALKYIYENAMERKTGRYIDSGDGTAQMRYGTRVEPLTTKLIKKYLTENSIDGKIKRVGFKVYPMIKTAGVSSDAVLKHEGKVIASIEQKACTNWSTHYDRTFDLVDDKNQDFWQLQSQMLAWGVDKTYYGVCQPPTDIYKYLAHEGDIMELYKDFKKECTVNVQVVEASKMHQVAMLKRIIIAESAISQFLKQGTDIKEILYKKIDYFKNNQEEFEIVEKWTKSK